MLYTEEEALDKTRLGISTFRRYLRLWEEIHCSLPTDVKGRKVVGDTLLSLIEATDDTRHHHRGNMAERLNDYMDANCLANIAEDYANSESRLLGRQSSCSPCCAWPRAARTAKPMRGTSITR